jgi:hypothetical protein
MNMKSKIFFLLFLFGLMNQFVVAQRFKIVTNMSDIRCAGDYSINKDQKADFCDDPIHYKAPQGSIFIKINDKPETIDGQTYILVKFIKVEKTANDIVKEFEKYLIPEDKFKSAYYVMFSSGFDWGFIALPFKLRFNPSTISPNATIGPYGGFKMALGYKWTISFIGTVGLSGISLNDINSEDVENVLGFTYAGGAIFSYDSKFQMGFVVGADFIGGDKGENWTYEHKPWIALATGFTFLK